MVCALQDEGRDVIYAREPGGTRISERIRAILLDEELTEMCAVTEMSLFIGARAQICTEAILPDFSEGKIVVLDRYGDSTLAYQGYGRGVDLYLIRELNRLATDGRVPDLTILCDCPVEFGLARKEPETWDRIDREERTFLRRVRQGYLELAGAEPNRWFVVDTTKSMMVVTRQIYKRVSDLLSKKKGEEQ